MFGEFINVIVVSVCSFVERSLMFSAFLNVFEVSVPLQIVLSGVSTVGTYVCMAETCIVFSSLQVYKF